MPRRGCAPSAVAITAVIASGAVASDLAHKVDLEFPNFDVAVAEAYRHAPRDRVVEVIDGMLYAMRRPGPPHQNAAIALAADLTPPFRRGRGGPGGWIVLPEPALHLGERPDLVEADLAGWYRDRLPAHPSDAVITVALDLACEILSTSTRRHDNFVKMPMYDRHHVGHVWLVDPEARTLQVFRRVTDGWLMTVTAAGDARARGALRRGGARSRRAVGVVSADDCASLRTRAWSPPR